MTNPNVQRGSDVRYAIKDSSIGFVLVAASRRGVCAVSFGDGVADLEQRIKDDFPAASPGGADAEMNGWIEEIIERIERPGTETDLPLDMAGTPFQKRVWKALREIPTGHTASYSQIAARIGHPTASRAVARACATNPVGVVVPCHRVIAADGKISGYAGGVDRKRALLNREAQANGVQREMALA
ncbi:MAG TPA: methylated-DNA--[protein]-cysteine S-methyltransferase [Tepidisphaeraceae bacterium]|jgi:AraC family transcriptional regulator of adaptative response/methylated-DNA-[protein]-cysteine methyltransferase|nr:methylated-DNA--[protein]-cysteine S-methyltransferase [Tepidisphaeraceae bacterium]